MKERINLGVLFGGRSCEHEVSVTSARSILKAIDQDKYNVHLIGIDKQGRWHLGEEFETLTHEGSVSALSAQSSSSTVSLELHDTGNITQRPTANNQKSTKSPKLDVLFPVLHGTFGEDGALQGALEMAGLPYVGCGIAASALAMDKALVKTVFESANIPQAPYIVATHREWQQDPDQILASIEEKLGTSVFTKPANLGSSVGISKSTTKDELIIAINHALSLGKTS